MNETGDLAFVPTGGFGFTSTSSDDLVFSGGTLVPGDLDTSILFAGGTIAKTTINDDGVSASSRFATATYYADISSDRDSTFTVDGEEIGTEIQSSTIGSFLEVSAGLTYVRILDEGAFAAARQLDASVRADYRISDDVDAFSVTGQVRLQF